MATLASRPAIRSERSESRLAAWAGNRFLLLAIGATASLFAVGGRFDVSLAAWIAPIFLLRFMRDSKVVPALCLIWAVMFIDTVWWTLQLGVRQNAAALVIALAFSSVFFVPYAVDRLVSPRLGLYGKLLLFPAAFASIEFLMGSLSPLGTAFGLRAITQTDNAPVLQLVALAGPYSIGFLINSMATTANWAWENRADRKSLPVLGAYAVVLFAILLGGALRLAFAPPPARYIPMAGITPDMNIQRAAEATLYGAGSDAGGSGLVRSRSDLATLSPAKLQTAWSMVTDDLLARTREAARAGAKVVIWSETAATTLDQFKPGLLAKAASVAREEHIYINVTMGQPFARNQTALIDPAGKVLWNYDKNHPVPGSEPVPPVSNPVPIVATPLGTLTNVICFDADFPGLTRVSADVMMVPGSEWPEIGRTHTLKMASVRAIENGYSLIRIAYNSQSAAFDRYGRVLATQDTTSRGGHIMYADVPVGGGRTLYNITGDILAWLSVFLFAAFLFVGFGNRGRQIS